MVYSLKRYAALALGLTFIATTGSRCRTPEDPYSCLNPNPVPKSSGTSGAEQLGSTQQPLYVASTKLWTQHSIPVCWESSGMAPEYAKSRETVKQAVLDTWQAALNYPGLPAEQRFQFVGWEACNISGDEGIHIHVNDEGPYVGYLGKTIAGKTNGMVLNFTYKTWSESCSSSEATIQDCNYVIAVHEFGHALGMAHEQNRPDTDREVCTDAPQGSDGDVLMGPWDADSVMNYCNSKWNNDGVLSAGDRLGVQAAYYPDYFNFDCLTMEPETPASSQRTPSAARGPRIQVRGWFARTWERYFSSPTALPFERR
jgi:hypothetical protein